MRTATPTQTTAQDIEVTHVGTDGPSVVRIGDVEYFAWDCLSHWKLEKFSTAGGETYTVHVRGQNGCCDCPDARWRKRVCKHVNAINRLMDVAW